MWRLLLLVFCLHSRTVSGANFTAAYEWDFLDYAYPSESARQRAIATGEFVPQTVFLSGIAVWGDRIFVGLPRLYYGVPATLATVPVPRARDTQRNVRVTPFPSWEANRQGDCTVLQHVKNMAVDTQGRLWIPDTGRIHIRESSPDMTCPPKILLMDLNNNNRIVHQYVVPPNVFDRRYSWFNNVALDELEGGYLYVTDANVPDPGIIVYSLAANDSWKVREVTSMHAGYFASYWLQNGWETFERVPVAGIAVGGAYEGPDKRVYFSPASSWGMFSMPSGILRNKTRSQRLTAAEIQNHGVKMYRNDGMAADEFSNVYFGMVPQSKIMKWASDGPLIPGANQWQVFADDENTKSWPDSFAVSEEGFLYVTLDDFLRYANRGYREGVYSSKISYTYIGARSYLYNQNSP